MEIQSLNTEQWARLKQLRIDALKDAPQAFGTTLEEAQNWGEAQWRTQIQELKTFVAAEKNHDIGMVRGEKSDTNSDSAFLISMWVSPASRGLGCGEALIGAVIAWANQAGYKRLELDVADENAIAIALYERMGFRPTGEKGTLPPPRNHVTEHRLALNLPSRKQIE